MSRTSLATVCLAALVVTAGCSGILDGSDGDRDPYGVPATGTATTGTATTGTTTMGTTTGFPGETTTLPPPAASPAFREVLANQTRALREARQFVYRERSGSTVGAGTSPLANRSVAVDAAAGRYWVGVPRDPADGVYDEGGVYQDGAAAYQRRERPDGTVTYRRVDREPTPRTFAWSLVERRSAPLPHLPFEPNGTATLAGEEVARFTASDPGILGCAVETGLLDRLRNVTSFSATALVDDRGIVRAFECSLAGYLYTGERYAERVAWRVTEVGTATVRPPDGVVEETPGGGNGTTPGRDPRGYLPRAVERAAMPDGPDGARRLAPDGGPVDDATLIDAAREAQSESFAPYSGYVVGAALLTDDGSVFTGCNVENANYSNSLHAEEVALGSAVAEGYRSFEAVAVSSGERDGVTPCGMCRQTLAEFCDDDFRVVCDLGGDDAREYALGHLLPDTIDAGTLDRD